MKKFEDTKLLQHPEVKAAYELLKEQVALERIEKFSPAFIDYLGTAELLSDLCKDAPHLVAATVALPVLNNVLYGRNPTPRAELDRAPLTQETRDLMSAYNAPLHVDDIKAFQRIPQKAQQGGVTIMVAKILFEMKTDEKRSASDRAWVRDKYSSFSLRRFKFITTSNVQEYADLCGLTAENSPVLAEAFKLAAKLGSKNSSAKPKSNRKPGGNGPTM